MSVTLTGQEGFFTRQGDFIGEYNRVATFYGSGLDDGFLSIWSQFASTDQAAVQNLPGLVNSFRSSGASYQQGLVLDGQQAMLLQTARNQSVVPYTVAQVLSLIETQMLDTAQTINRPVLGSLVTPDAGNLGDATIVVSTTNIYGDPLDMTLAETLTVTCTSGGSFSASMGAVGAATVSPSAYNWPQGSGASASFTIVDPASTSLVTDGGFAQWSGTGSNTPTRWTIVNGSAGVTVFKSVSGGVRTGTDAAQITSDGASATQLSQSVSLSINTVYAACFWAKINTITATGTFQIALTDGDGNILSDDAGTPLSYTRNVNGQISGTYALFTVFFSTPRLLPDTVKIQIGTSVAATAGRIITFDLVGLVAATPLYGAVGTGTAGPYIAGFSGVDPTAVNDVYSVAFTNSLTTKSFVFGMERLYGLRNMGTYLPSSISPTIPDSLVTH